MGRKLLTELRDHRRAREFSLAQVRFSFVMSVIPFSAARFTPSDIKEFTALAGPKLQRGLWAGITRETGRDFDRLLVTLPGISRSVFSFERDRRGDYHLLFYHKAGWYSIGSGRTAAECLAVCRPHTPLETAEDGPVGERA